MSRNNWSLANNKERARAARSEYKGLMIESTRIAHRQWIARRKRKIMELETRIRAIMAKQKDSK